MSERECQKWSKDGKRFKFFLKFHLNFKNCEPSLHQNESNLREHAIKHCRTLSKKDEKNLFNSSFRFFAIFQLLLGRINETNSFARYTRLVFLYLDTKSFSSGTKHLMLSVWLHNFVIECFAARWERRTTIDSTINSELIDFSLSMSKLICFVD